MKKILFIILIITSFFVTIKGVNAYQFDKDICQYEGIAHKGADLLGEVSIPTVSIEGRGTNDEFIMNVNLGDKDGIWTQTILSNYMTKFYMGEPYSAFNGKINYDSDSIRTAFVKKAICPPYVVVSIAPLGNDKRATVKNISFPSTPPSDCSSWYSAFDGDYTFCSVSNTTNNSNFLFPNYADYYLLHSNTCPKAMTDIEFLTMILNVFKQVLSQNGNSTLMKMAQYKYVGDISKDMSEKLAPGGACAAEKEKATDTLKMLLDQVEDWAPSVTNAVGQHDTSEDPNEYKNKCQYILGDPSEEGYFAYYLDMSFKFIKFAAPALLIVMSIVDYIKVIAASDADAMKKTNEKTIKRIIFTLLIFVLPTLISMVLNLLGLQGSCDFPNISGI